MKNLLKIVFGFFAFLFVVGLVAPHGGKSSGSGANGQASNLNLPPDELSFVQIIADSQAKATDAENDMQKGGIKAVRDKAICKLIKKRKIANWVGVISTIDANSDGKGVLGIEIAPKVIVTTWNNEFSDLEDKTLLDPSSAFFKAVSGLKVGRVVSFSGSFRPSPGGECIKESSLTLGGKLRQPEFIFQFSDLSF